MPSQQQQQQQQSTAAARPPPQKPGPLPEVVTSLVEDQYGYAVQKEIKLKDVPDKTDGKKMGMTCSTLVEGSAQASRRRCVM